MDFNIIPLVLVFVLAPIAFMGAIGMLKKMNSQRLIKAGAFKVIFRKNNGQRISKYIVPTSAKEIKHKGKTFPLSTEHGYVWWEGKVPIVEYYWELSKQIRIGEKLQDQSLDPEYLDTLLVRVFNLGKLAGAKDEKLIKVCCLVAAGAAILSVVLVFALLSSVADIGDKFAGLAKTANEKFVAINDYMNKHPEGVLPINQYMQPVVVQQQGASNFTEGIR